ncbi:MAG: hypothetical protein NTW07_08225, partial [candidate division Zixibacteria bacterium]|nr:hypothetical protein [candidate division Zixibacteria bacterium]
MKIKLLVGVLVLLFGLPVMAAPPARRAAQDAAQSVDNVTYIAANNILMFVTNHGNFGRDLGGVFGNDYGTYFPFSTTTAISSGANTLSPYYAGGLWIGGVDSVTQDTLMVISEYSSEYVPGPTLDGSFLTDRPEFHVYKLYRDSLANNPNDDYLAWPVDQGAPVNEDGTPKMIGDQMCWSVYNDLDPDQHAHDAGSTAPLGLEVRQTVFSFQRKNGSLANIVFLKYHIFNRGDKTLQNCFFSIWSDPDLGDAADDLVGTDTTRNLAFTYNSTDDDIKYAALNQAVPSIGIDFFQGPLVYTGEETDTALMWDSTWVGYKNMGLYSFNKYINGTDPDSYQQAYMFQLGLDAKNGGIPYVNPITGQPTRFVMSGDPTAGANCAGEGWLDDTPADRRHMQTTGPLTFRPGDSTEILAAMVVGQASGWCSSVTLMKQIDDFAQRVYENGFNPPRPPAKPVVTVAQTPNRISLSWTDTSEVDPGDFSYEGYTVWQGESESGPWRELATYDLVNHRLNGLVDTLLDPYSGLKFPMAIRAITNSGIDRMYTVGEDAIRGGRLNNLTTYYFKVSAFSWAERMVVDSTTDPWDTTWIPGQDVNGQAI